MTRLFALIALGLAATASADTLLLEGISMDSATADQRPRRGMSMESVESRFGAPTSRVAPVGEPPISRWEYPGFIVYFEHDLVLHAAVRH
jgi:hypothetical protein